MGKNLGGSFERSLVDRFAIMERQGICRIRKCDPPTRTVRIKGQPVTIPLDNPFPDFIGCMSNGVGSQSYGLMVAIEAKSTGNGRLPLRRPGKSGSGVTYTQLLLLRSWGTHGAFAGVLWDDRKGGRQVWFPIHVLLECYEAGKCSVGAEDGDETFWEWFGKGSP